MRKIFNIFVCLQVSDRIAPSYSKIIKRKMALSNMKTKIYRGDYSTIEDFQEDVQLIVDNCRKFNAGAEGYVKVRNIIHDMICLVSLSTVTSVNC